MTYRLERMTETHRRPAIDLYNHYVRTGFASYLEEPVPFEEYDRFLAIASGYPAYVATLEATGEFAGFSFLHAHRAVATFRRTAEITYFLRPEHTRRGLGSLILARFEAETPALGVDILLASVSSRNEAGLRFHESHGFVECGRFVKIGRKHGEDFDVVWFEKRLQDVPN